VLITQVTPPNIDSCVLLYRATQKKKRPPLEDWNEDLDSNTDLSPILDEQHAAGIQLGPAFQQTHVDDQPVIEFSEELNLTKPPFLTESAEQPGHCTDGKRQQSTDNDDAAVSAPPPAAPTKV
jgi:hypothetical protein